MIRRPLCPGCQRRGYIRIENGQVSRSVPREHGLAFAGMFMWRCPETGLLYQPPAVWLEAA